MSALRIACLVQDAPPLRHFVSRIHEEFPVQLIVVERGDTTASAAARARRMGVGDLVQAVRNRWRGRRAAEARRADWQRWFGDHWQAFPDGVARLDVPNINDPTVVERLRAERIDVILDHGTTIVRDAVLETAPMALNLHWGLSPYYRGTACTEWALVNWDPFTIGVTVHRLARQIDGGGIVAQARAKVGADDTPHRLNMQLTALGTDLTIRILRRMAAGQVITEHPQDFSRGFLTLNRQWSRPLARQIEHILATGQLADMLRHPARRGMAPIIELDAP